MSPFTEINAIKIGEMINIEDKQLMTLLETDPDQGIRCLNEQYAEPLRLAAAQRLSSPDDVQECVHDALADFYLQRDLFDGAKGSLRSYLTAIVNRKAIRKYRENQRQWLVTELTQQATRDIDRWERSEALHHALRQMPEQDRRILEMKYFHGHTAKEIAAMLGMEYETVKKRLQRGLKKLLRLMEE